MTKDILDPATSRFTVDGTGPYALDRPYESETDFVVYVIDGTTVAELDASDWTIAPSGPASDGDLTLTSGAATTHDAKALVIERRTPLEQGFEGQNTREDGFEAQLDKTMMGVQENRRSINGALRLMDGEVAKPFEPDTGTRAIMWNSTAGQFESGPEADEITAAQEYAEGAGDAKTAAQAAQAAAEIALDDFTDLYLGAKSSDPALDNDGDALQDGALYFNTTDNKMRVYDLSGTAWVDYEADAIAAKDAAETAQTAAETAQSGAETAETNAETAQTAAEAARDLAETYAGVVARATTEADLIANYDPTGLTAGDLGIVSGSGNSDEDGLWEVQANTPNEWVRVGDSGVSGLRADVNGLLVDTEAVLQGAQDLRRPGGWLVLNTSNRVALQADGTYLSNQANWSVSWDFEITGGADFFVDWPAVSGVTITVEERDASSQIVAPVAITDGENRRQATITANASSTIARVTLAGASSGVSFTSPSVTLGKAAIPPSDPDYLSLLVDTIESQDGAFIGAGISSASNSSVTTSGQTATFPSTINVTSTVDFNLSTAPENDFVCLVELTDGTVPRSLTVAPVAADGTVGTALDVLTYRWGDDHTRFLVRVPYQVSGSTVTRVRLSLYLLGGGGPNVGINDDFVITLRPYSTNALPALRTLPTAYATAVADQITDALALERAAIQAERDREAALIRGDDDAARMITARIEAALRADAFVSTDGNDSDAGTITAPKLTSQTATGAAAAGTGVLHKRGQTHPRLGTASGAQTMTQLEVGAYGDGLTRAQLDSRVKLDGLTWTLVSGTRYKTTATLTITPSMNGASADNTDHFRLFDCRESEIGTPITWYSSGASIADNQASVDADTDPAFTIYRTGSTVPDPRNDTNSLSYDIELDIGSDPNGLDFRLTQRNGPVVLVGGALRDCLIAGWSGKDGGGMLADSDGVFPVLENTAWFYGSAHAPVGPCEFRGVNVFAVGARQPSGAATVNSILNRSGGGGVTQYTAVDHSDKMLRHTGITYVGDASNAYYAHTSSNDGYLGLHHEGILRAFNANTAIKFDGDTTNPTFGAGDVVFDRVESGPHYIPVLNELRDGCDKLLDAATVNGGVLRIRSGYHKSGVRTRAAAGNFITANRTVEIHIGEWGGFTYEPRYNIGAASVETIDGVAFDSFASNYFAANAANIAGQEPVIHCYGVEDLSPTGKKAFLSRVTNGGGDPGYDIHLYLKRATLDERGRTLDTPKPCTVGDLADASAALPLTLSVEEGCTFGLFNRSRADIRTAMTGAGKTVSIDDETWIVNRAGAIIDVPVSLGGTT